MQKNHPDMIDIECNVMAGAAIQYSRFLVNSKNDLRAVKDISDWLQVHNVYINKGGIKRKAAYFLLFHYPSLFYCFVRFIWRIVSKLFQKPGESI